MISENDKALVCASFIVMCGEYLKNKKKVKSPKKRRWWMTTIHHSRNK